MKYVRNSMAKIYEMNLVAWLLQSWPGDVTLEDNEQSSLVVLP